MSFLPTPKIRAARLFAVRKHGDQKYSEFPYVLHLQMVESVLLRFGITDEDFRTAAMLHDTVEDTDATVEEIASLFGDRVAAIVDAVSEPKGLTRREKHAIAYPRIRQNPDAIVLKLADRIANVEAGGKKIGMYVKEHADFRRALYRDDSSPIVKEMWNYLSELLVQAPTLKDAVGP